MGSFFTRRHKLLLNGLNRWRARTTSIQRQQQSQDDAISMHRGQLLSQGFKFWTQVIFFAKVWAASVSYSGRLELGYNHSLPFGNQI